MQYPRVLLLAFCQAPNSLLIIDASVLCWDEGLSAAPVTSGTEHACTTLLWCQMGSWLKLKRQTRLGHDNEIQA